MAACGASRVGFERRPELPVYPRLRTFDRLNYQWIRSNAVDEALREQMHAVQAENEDLRAKVIRLEETLEAQAASGDVGELPTEAKIDAPEVVLDRRRPHEEIRELIEESRDNPITERVEAALVDRWRGPIYAIVPTVLLVYTAFIDSIAFSNQRLESFPTPIDTGVIYVLVFIVVASPVAALVFILGVGLLILTSPGVSSREQLYDLWEGSADAQFSARVRRLPLASKRLLRTRRREILGVSFQVRAIFFAGLICVIASIVAFLAGLAS